MTGNRFGVAPNGRMVELPVFIKFGFRDDLIAGELFFSTFLPFVRRLAFQRLRCGQSCLGRRPKLGPIPPQASAMLLARFKRLPPIADLQGALHEL